MKFLITLLFCLSPLYGQAVLDGTGAFSNAACATSCTGSPITITDQTNQQLIVFVGQNSSTADATATWDVVGANQAMTPVTTARCATTYSAINTFYLNDPVAGLKVLTIGNPGTNIVWAIAMSVSNVEQNAPTDTDCATTFHPNPDETSHLTMTAIIGDMVLCGANARDSSGGSNLPWTADNGTLQQNAQVPTTGSLHGAASLVADGVSEVMGFAGGSGQIDVRWAMGCIVLDEIAATTGGAVFQQQQGGF